MCGRFSGITEAQAARLAGDLSAWAAGPGAAAGGAPTRPDPAYDWPLQAPFAVPGTAAWIIVPAAGDTATAGGNTGKPAFAPAHLTWGFSVSWHTGPLFNTRLESAVRATRTATSLWRGALERGRCLVPVRAFFEPHATERIRSPKTKKPIKRSYRFTAADGAPVLLLAGVSAAGRFSVVTVPPNAQVAPVHDRMPLVLSATEAITWLSADGAAPILAQAADLADRSGTVLAAAPETDDPLLTGDNGQLSLF